MDNTSAALLREGLETEKRIAFKVMQETDLSDAKPIPTSVQYRSSSIAAEPYFDKELIQKTVARGFKPQITRSNFERSKKSFGMVSSELSYVLSRDDYRPTCQFFRLGKEETKKVNEESLVKDGTIKRNEIEMRPVPDALRNTEYYGKPDATSRFYRRSGAFYATEEKDH